MSEEIPFDLPHRSDWATCTVCGRGMRHCLGCEIEVEREDLTSSRNTIILALAIVAGGLMASTAAILILGS